MAEERNGGEQLDIEESGDFAIADDSQIARRKTQSQLFKIRYGRTQRRKFRSVPQLGHLGRTRFCSIYTRKNLLAI